MNAGEQGAGTSSKGIIIAIIAGAILIPGLGSAYLIYSRVGVEQPAFDAVADYFVASNAILPRVSSVGSEFMSVTVTRETLEVVDAQGQRHSISPNGEWLRRGAPGQAGPSFALAAVDFAKLPVVLAAATTDGGGGTPSSASVELVEGVPRWRVSVGAQVVVYELDGTLVRKP